jgi:hypothetical protein
LTNESCWIISIDQWELLTHFHCYVFLTSNSTVRPPPDRARMSSTYKYKLRQLKRIFYSTDKFIKYSLIYWIDIKNMHIKYFQKQRHLSKKRCVTAWSINFISIQIIFLCSTFDLCFLLYWTREGYNKYQTHHKNNFFYSTVEVIHLSFSDNAILF